MAIDEKISKLVKDQFPAFYQEEGANFIAFIEAYYEYLEQEGKLTHEIRNLQNYKDISETTDQYLEYFRRDLLHNIPTDILADKALLAKHIKEFNKARGSFKSYKLMFRALFNEDVEINYPADQILKVSDGDYRIDRYLVTSYDSAHYQFIGRTIKGQESFAECLVEDVVRRVIRGRDLMQILVSNIKGSFNHLETVRLLTDTTETGHSAIVEAGIRSVTIASPGGQYEAGDVLSLISDIVGEFGKIVITSTVDLGGSITFSIVDGGSGYRSSTNIPGSTIQIIGGDGTEKASFIIDSDDLNDLFAIAINTNILQGNNVFGALAPSFAGSGRMDKYANTPLCAPDFGFPEFNEVVGNRSFRDHSNATLRIANTQEIKVSDSLYGVTSTANCTVLSIVDATAANTVVRIDGYRNFSGLPTQETIRSRFSNTSGNNVGTCIDFQGNTIGYHVVTVGNTPGNAIIEGQELVGRTSNTFAVIKKVVSNQANGYTRGPGGADDRNLVTLQVTANNTANLCSLFDTGPMRHFGSNEGVRIVGANTTVGNVASFFANTEIETVYTALEDAFLFQTGTIGTIASLSLPIGGAGYSIAPIVDVRENNIAALGIGEQYLTLQSDDENWDSGNSSFLKLDTNDKVVQGAATGHVKGGLGSSPLIAVNQYGNGTYEMAVRVWQDFVQREPGGITYANNATCTLQIYDSSHIQGEDDNRSIADTATAKIVSIDDRGILGDNADISATVGANGTITGVRILDSGFAYKDNELVTVEGSGRPDAVSGTLRLDINGVANAEGYYFSTRSHVSSSRGFIQDSRFYQEYSYELALSLSLSKYRDIALQLVHPAGQALFGKYKSQSNTFINVSANTNNQTRSLSNGTVALFGSDYALLTGASGTYLSTPDKATYTPSSTLLIRGYVNSDDYTKIQTIASHYDDSGVDQRSYNFYIDATSALALGTSTDGTLGNTVTDFSSAPVPVSNGTGIWVQTEWTLANGNVDFSTNTVASSTTDPASVSFVQLGLSQAGGTACHNSNTSLLVGAYNDGTGARFDGKISRVQVLTDGTVVADMNPNKQRNPDNAGGDIFGDLDTVEQITNSGFDIDSDWILPAWASISGGKLILSPSGAGNVRQVGALTPGEAYEIKIDIESIDGTGITVRCGADHIGQILKKGIYTGQVLSTDTVVDIINWSVSSNVVIDSISAKRIDNPWTQEGNVKVRRRVDVLGTSTDFLAEFANNDIIIIEYADKSYYQLPLNIVTDDISANVKIAWSNSDISGANAYYYTGSI